MKGGFISRIGKKKGTFSTVSEKSSIDASKRMFSDKSMMSRISQEKEELTEENKLEKILDMLTINYHKEKEKEVNDNANSNNIELPSSSKALPIIDLNKYCIENSKNELLFLSKMRTANDTLSQFGFTSPKEEGEKCQLVEKVLVDKLKQENEELAVKIKKMKAKIEEKTKGLFKATGESNYTKQASDYQKRLRGDNARHLHFLQETYADCSEYNRLLREKLTEKKIEKDTLFQAVYSYIERYDKNMAEELTHLHQCYNNQYYMCETKGVDEKYIDDLFGEINALDRKISNRNNEIKELEKFVLPEKKKAKGLSSSSASAQLKRTPKPSSVLLA